VSEGDKLMKEEWTKKGYNTKDIGPAVVLLGNGLNWATRGPSWEDLLDELKRAVSYPNNIDKQKPFPLIYEELYLHGLEKGLREDELLNLVANHCKKLGPGQLHEKLSKMPLKHILTTNYDQATVSSFLSSPDSDNTALVIESRYSLFRRSESNSKVVWTIHGSQNAPNSIMLGYDHYCGYLEQMRRYVTRGVTYQGVRARSLVKNLSEGSDLVKSWLDFFFTRRVIILGLTLDFHELHLWWLLTYRARRKKEGRSFVSGDVYFLSRQIIPEKGPKAEDSKRKKEALERKHDLLKAAGVNVVIIEENDPNDREIHYLAALDRTRKLIESA
jgi:hypothetical protein